MKTSPLCFKIIVFDIYRNFMSNKNHYSLAAKTKWMNVILWSVSVTGKRTKVRNTMKGF